MALNTVVIGISTDSVERSKGFCDSTGIPYELGSDASGDICRLYDVRRRFGLGTSRVTYIIDSAGMVRGAFHDEIRMRSHVRNALQTLESIESS